MSALDRVASTENTWLGGSLHPELFLQYLHKYPLELSWCSGPVGTHNLAHSMSSVAIRLSRECPVIQTMVTSLYTPSVE